MKVRLIKPNTTPAKPKAEAQPNDVEIIDTIRSWVRDFKLRKANKARLEFRRISSNPEPSN